MPRRAGRPRLRAGGAPKAAFSRLAHIAHGRVDSSYCTSPVQSSSVPGCQRITMCLVHIAQWLLREIVRAPDASPALYPRYKRGIL